PRHGALQGWLRARAAAAAPRAASLFFLLIGRPPCSTLFPYTTLFRSLSNVEEVMARGGRVVMISDAAGVARLEGRLAFGIAIPQDRKSTRLNSSHVAISYAVFCLKKKKARLRRRLDAHAHCQGGRQPR